MKDADYSFYTRAHDMSNLVQSSARFLELRVLLFT